ncbi:MAG: hypothetical protein WAU25_14590, partial [Nitrososphaeraceae archaeon]
CAARSTGLKIERREVPKKLEFQTNEGIRDSSNDIVIRHLIQNIYLTSFIYHVTQIHSYMSLSWCSTCALAQFSNHEKDWLAIPNSL